MNIGCDILEFNYEDRQVFENLEEYLLKIYDTDDNEEEKRLLIYLDGLVKRGCKVVISNVLEYKGSRNSLLLQWIEEHQAEILQTTFRGRRETLIIAQ